MKIVWINKLYIGMILIYVACIERKSDIKGVAHDKLEKLEKWVRLKLLK